MQTGKCTSAGMKMKSLRELLEDRAFKEAGRSEPFYDGFLAAVNLLLPVVERTAHLEEVEAEIDELRQKLGSEG